MLSVLVDITPPEAGTVHDGENKGQDMSFSSATATKQCYWDGFSDPESDVTNYDVSLYINHELQKRFHQGTGTDFIDNSVTMYHEDEIEFIVTSTNGAGSTTDVRSDGFKVDHTPPNMIIVYAANAGMKYQTSTNELNLKWQFEDRESGIKEYRYCVYEQLHGSKSRLWPLSAAFATINQTVQGGIEAITLGSLSLSDGGKYSLHVTAVNHGGMSSAHESDQVMVDSTPPVMLLVSNYFTLLPRLLSRTCRVFSRLLTLNTRRYFLEFALL